MEIGTKTQYTRFADGKVLTGEGVIKGIGLDPENRIVVLVRDGKHRFTIHKAALTSDPAFVAKFSEMSNKVTELGTKGNAEQDATAKKYNGEIQALKDGILGAPLALDEVEPVLQNDAAQAGEATHNMD